MRAVKFWVVAVVVFWAVEARSERPRINPVPAAVRKMNPTNRIAKVANSETVPQKT